MSKPEFTRIIARADHDIPPGAEWRYRNEDGSCEWRPERGAFPEHEPTTFSTYDERLAWRVPVQQEPK
jgi:hypothetical protein